MISFTYLPNGAIKSDRKPLQIARHTGNYPVFSEEERYRLVSALKFVDQVSLARESFRQLIDWLI